MGHTTITRNYSSDYKFDVQHVSKRQGPLARFLNYCDKQVGKSLFWYMIPVLVISCMVMPLAFFALYLSGGTPIWFVALSMILFFTNVLVSVAELHPRVTISTFILTLIVLLSIPVAQVAMNGITLWP